MALTVSTSCPSCGGGIDFEEGSNAVHCPYCGLDHVVTGHGRVLSYFIPEKIPVNRAVALALKALRAGREERWRALDATLFFVPYYRFAGQVLRWEVQETVVGTGGAAMTSAKPIGAVSAEDILVILSGEPGTGAARLGEKRFELDGRYTDRTLPALDVADLKIYSLGLRPSALKLSLFEKDAVAARGQIAPASFSYAEKEQKGYSPVRPDELVARRVFAKTRSVVYFPVWVVEADKEGGDGSGRVLAVLDGLTGTVTNPAAPVSLLDSLVAKGEHSFETARFRPLVCPDCAGPLPLKPRDVVFFCPVCKKAWHIDGSELKQISYTVAKPRSIKPGALEYLPFWVVRAKMSTPEKTVENKFDLSRLAPGMTWPKEEDKEVPLRFFVPAFRMGNLKALSRVASSFTRYQPVFEGDTPRNSDGAFRAKGCYISHEDALELAPLILFSLVPKGNKVAVRFALEADVTPLDASLVLIPYYRGRFEYVDGLFGWTVPANSIKL